MASREGIASFIAALVLIAAAYALVRIAAGVTTPFVVVEGRSMIPTLYNGDIVLIYKPAPSDIKIGDIVVYVSEQGHLVIHRVVEINNCLYMGESTLCYVTKGDNNMLPDPYLPQGLEGPQGVPYENVLGVVVAVEVGGVQAPLRLPYLGLITTALRG